VPQSDHRTTRRWGTWAHTLRECYPRVQSTQLLPSFFIIGPPRTGTTWLHEVLRKRTLLPSLTKETRFFDQHFERGLYWYRAHFPNPNGNRCVGEIAPTYFASAEARQRIKALVPNAKIACIFRDPVERLHSLYRVKKAYGMIPWSFEQALLHDPELTESSRYATHLRAWQNEFGVEQVLPTLYDDLRDSPQKYVDQLADFLGIARFALTDSELEIVHASESMTHPRCYLRTRGATFVADWLKARHLGPFVRAIKRSRVSKLFLGGGLAFTGLSREAAATVQELFRREIDDLETMLHRDLSAWKPEYSGFNSAQLAA
jgi:hypothetical protein